VEANLLVGFDIDPAATRKTATRKSNRVSSFAIENREFQIAVEGRGIDRFPIHDGIMIAHQAGRL